MPRRTPRSTRAHAVAVTRPVPALEWLVAAFGTALLLSALLAR
jgi:hypothetical protein